MRNTLLIAGIVGGFVGTIVVAGAATTPSPPEKSDDLARQSQPQSSPEPETEAPQPEVGLLTPIPENGGLPRIYSKMYDLTEEEHRHRAVSRNYAKQIRVIRYKHFGQMRAVHVREQGIELLREFVDPASFKPMIEELKAEADDVKLAMLDHFAKRGDEGQAALGWIAIFDRDSAIRNEALARMVSPVGEPVLYLLNGALQHKEAEVANAAASVASALNVLQTVPLLIFAQAAGEPNEGQTGDLAWIAFQTQRAYVQGLVPVTGDNSGAFQPIVGIVSDGVVMRVMDAVVIEYRTVVHTALVNMTSSDWGRSTADKGYNIRAWWDWYNNEYVPFKRKQALEAELSKTPKPDTGGQPSQTP